MEINGEQMKNNFQTNAWLLRLLELARLEERPLDRVNREVLRENLRINADDDVDEIAERLNDLIEIHPQYSNLAARLLMDQLQLNVPSTFSECVENIVKYGQTFHPRFLDFVKSHASRLNEMVNQRLDLCSFDYFGVKTLLRSYLLRKRRSNLSDRKRHAGSNGASIDEMYGIRGVLETPQYMFMRVAVGLYAFDPKAGIEPTKTTGTTDWAKKRLEEYVEPKTLEEDDETKLTRIEETYYLLSRKYYVHASPTLFNTGLRDSRLASCYVFSVEDELSHMMDVLKKCVLANKDCGGVGVNITNIRAAGSPIASTNETSRGVVPFVRMFDAASVFVNEGGKRSSAMVFYIEPWHADIFEFVGLCRNVGNECELARNVFVAIWSCDLFMRRMMRNEEWSLMCPKECPGLTDTYGLEFERLYERYENEGKFVRRVSARSLYTHMCTIQAETGQPYMMHKDHVNRRNNQANLGTIRGSNLCSEITLFSSRDEVAVCNLASISLASFVLDARNDVCAECSYRDEKFAHDLVTNRYAPDCPKCFGGFDYYELYCVSRTIVRNLDRTIDAMSYSFPETKRSNYNNRPLGIGVQGLANVFLSLRISWDSEEARIINRRVFETIYRATLHESCLLAKRYGAYPSYPGSPASMGELQHDMYLSWAIDFKTANSGASSTDPTIHAYRDADGKKLDEFFKLADTSESTWWSWPTLRRMIREHGLRNCTRIAVMPTASTAQILGNVESIEPLSHNYYVRHVQHGSYVILNRYLVEDVEQLGLWNDSFKRDFVRSRGSIVEMVDSFSESMRSVYKGAWELSQRLLIELNGDRQPFVDQSVSFNLYMDDSLHLLSRSHVLGWGKGCKTTLYYLRSKPATNPIQFSTTFASARQNNDVQRRSIDESKSCELENDNCTACQG